MSAMSATPKKNLMLFSGRAHPELAEQVAKHLDVTITPQRDVRLVSLTIEDGGVQSAQIQGRDVPVSDGTLASVFPEVRIWPALEHALKCSHLFNILDSSGSIGVTERTAYILRARQLAVKIAQAYVGPPSPDGGAAGFGPPSPDGKRGGFGVTGSASEGK